MPWVLVVFLLLISTSVGAVEPKGFVLEGAFKNDDGSIHRVIFPGQGQIAIFKTLEFCDMAKEKMDVEIHRAHPDWQFAQRCVVIPEGIKRGVEKRPETI